MNDLNNIKTRDKLFTNIQTVSVKEIFVPLEVLIHFIHVFWQQLCPIVLDHLSQTSGVATNLSWGCTWIFLTKKCYYY